MSMRMAPPARASSSHRGLVKPRGPHHFATCLGSVHALKTRSRGASKTRVNSTSRGAESVTGLLAAAMFFLLRLKFAKIVIKAVKAFVPESAVMLDPVGHALERLGPQAAGPPLGVAAPGNQPGTLEHLQVL